MSPTWMMAGLSPLIWMTGGVSVAACALVVEVVDSGELGVGFWMDRSRILETERVTDFGRSVRHITASLSGGRGVGCGRCGGCGGGRQAGKSPSNGGRGLRTLCAWSLCEEEPPEKPTRIGAVVQYGARYWVEVALVVVCAGRARRIFSKAEARRVVHRG